MYMTYFANDQHTVHNLQTRRVDQITVSATGSLSCSSNLKVILTLGIGFCLAARCLDLSWLSEGGCLLHFCCCSTLPPTMIALCTSHQFPEAEDFAAAYWIQSGIIWPLKFVASWAWILEWPKRFLNHAYVIFNASQRQPDSAFWS